MFIPVDVVDRLQRLVNKTHKGDPGICAEASCYCEKSGDPLMNRTCDHCLIRNVHEELKSIVESLRNPDKIMVASRSYKAFTGPLLSVSKKELYTGRRR